ncbi:methyltransferase domain-containing protein [Kribbella yunnanensis]|uniref:methyltransferase domain-containing protein n=1 Tax=Kribbella yunnanensis TaxID=190194 RepID=UPI0031DC0542
MDAAQPDWLSTVYSNSVLVTQVKPIAGQSGAEGLTSSSSMPALMADMIEELGIKPGMRVLEIGTGTGYNAAILCHLLGDDAVTTLDIDQELVAQAKDRLAGLGYQPSFDPQPATYDRILATHAVAEIPADWIRWSKPGGVILTDLRSPANSILGAWAKLTVSDDGQTATGVLMPARGFFMSARVTPELADIGEVMPEFTADEHERRAESIEARPTAVPASVFDSEAFGLYFWRQSPEISWWVGEGTAGLNGRRAESWAYVEDLVVHYGGVEDLWVQVERAFAAWAAAGKPEMPTWKVVVNAAGRLTVVLPGAALTAVLEKGAVE